MKRLISLFCACMLCLTALGGCADKKDTQDELPDLETGPIVETADPQAAIDEIYKTVDIMGLADADEEVLEKKFFIDISMLDEFYVKYSSGRYGVADTFILKPNEDSGPQVRDQLAKVKIDRTKEFENYDIYDSYQIAQEAQIFEQGGYLVLLMLKDAEGAREIIDKYIPKE